MVSVGCNADCGLGSCVGGWDIRVCEGMQPCDSADSQHLLQADFGECSTGQFSLAETCPVATFVCPPSGNYTVLGAADIDGDNTSSCNLATSETPPGSDGGTDGGDASQDGGNGADATDGPTGG